MSTETIVNTLTDRPKTRLGICPFSFKISPPGTVVTPGGAPPEQQITFTNCVGAACHLWQFEPGTDPATGDCAVNITAQAGSLTAGLLHRMFNSPAAQAAQDAAASAPQA